MIYIKVFYEGDDTPLFVKINFDKDDYKIKADMTALQVVNAFFNHFNFTAAEYISQEEYECEMEEDDEN